jgi:UDP-N-acetylglucosamine--N-acetylmuramyl-(pentapeptide) pyrophosphoryl-undecaprenol N-acetylglucosamine transferase
MRSGGTTCPAVVIACGGTGGHLFPGVAVGERLRGLGARVVLVVSNKAVDQRAVQGLTDVEIVSLPLGGVLGGGWFGRLARWRAAYGLARQLVRERRPAALLGMGGFASALPFLAAKQAGVPAFVHEANCIPGRANRWLARWADAAFVYFPEAASRLRCREVNVSGMPVRAGIAAADTGVCRRRLGLDPADPVLLICGGSQGASALNRLVTQALPELRQALPELQYLHLAGATEAGHVRAAYSAAHCRALVCDFVAEMDQVLGAASVAVSRAGASSLAEFAALRLPSVLIPYPSATDNHQFHNALSFVGSGAARMIGQGTASPQNLCGLVVELLRAGGGAARMRAALEVWHTPEAADLVARRLLACVDPARGVAGGAGTRRLATAGGEGGEGDGDGKREAGSRSPRQLVPGPRPRAASWLRENPSTLCKP